MKKSEASSIFSLLVTKKLILKLLIKVELTFFVVMEVLFECAKITNKKATIKREITPYKRSAWDKDGGGSGIRTHDTVSRMPVFKTGTFNHSAIPPMKMGHSIM